MSSMYRVFWGQCQLDYVENWMKAAHGGGSWRWYVLFLTFLTMGKGPNLQCESFLDSLVVWISLASK